MEFIDSLLELSAKTGWEPIDIFFFSMCFSIFLWEFIPWSFSWVVRGVVYIFRQLRAHRKKDTD